MEDDSSNNSSSNVVQHNNRSITCTGNNSTNNKKNPLYRLVSNTVQNQQQQNQHKTIATSTMSPTNALTSTSLQLDNDSSHQHYQQHLHHHQFANTNNNNYYHLESHVLMGLTIAGIASTIIHTMMGLQTERHILSKIAASATATATINSNDNTIIRNLDILLHNNMNNTDAATTVPVSQIMIRTTMSPKLHYDLLIRLIGTAIILYYSIHPLPFQYTTTTTTTTTTNNNNNNNANHQQYGMTNSKTTMKVRTRLDMIGTMGLLFVLIFVILQHSTTISIMETIMQPCYEWMRILLIVIIASPVINDLSMYDTKRIQFIMSGQIMNFITTIIVRYMYEESIISYILHIPNTNRFNITTILFTILSCTLFIMAQNMIRKTNINSNNNNTTKSFTLLSPWYVLSPFIPTTTITRRLLPSSIFGTRMIKVHTDMDLLHSAEIQQQQQQYQQQYAMSNGTTSQSSSSSSLPLMESYRMIRDICALRNMQRWIIMQLLLEVQMSVLYLLFLYTILYEIDDIGNSRVVWTLFRLRKVDTILIHIPMFLFGYTGVYYTLFITIFGLSLFANFLTQDPSHAIGIVHLLTIVFYISCMAVHSAGFNVAMADLTMSIRHHYTNTDHHPFHNYRRSMDEPNIAGIVIAYNSFICKPITYFVSGIIANILQHSRSHDTVTSTAFYILIYTTFVSSAIQLVVWRRYDLIPQRTVLMRDEVAQRIPK